MYCSHVFSSCQDSVSTSVTEAFSEMTYKVPSSPNTFRLQEHRDSLPHAHITSCAPTRNVVGEINHVTQDPKQFRATVILIGGSKGKPGSYLPFERLFPACLNQTTVFFLFSLNVLFPPMLPIYNSPVTINQHPFREYFIQPGLPWIAHGFADGR